MNCFVRTNRNKLLSSLNNYSNSVINNTSIRTLVVSNFYQYKVQPAGCFGYRPKLNQFEPTCSFQYVNNENHLDHTVSNIINHYRLYGHFKADIDPLRLQQRSSPEIDLMLGRLSESFLSKSVQLRQDLGDNNEINIKVQELIECLEETYCKNITLDIKQVSNRDEFEWLCKEFERERKNLFTDEEKLVFLKTMLHSMVLDSFLGKKFPTLKRYSGEGAESMLVFFVQSFKEVQKHGLEHYLTCIAHRGRTNLLTGLFDLPLDALFSKIRGNPEFAPNYNFSGDVLSHLVSSKTINNGDRDLNVSMLPNPSHLEAVNPVAMGNARSLEMSQGLGSYSSSAEPGDKVFVTQVHGDAAFCGQGINMEMFALSQLPHFDIGGCLHLITNNQIGFTTPTERAKSSLHGSDVGKMINCPVIRVNGDYPEDVARACSIATEYRMKFKKDVIVDMMCYRRWGHNELDNPSLTQPLMYETINSRKAAPLVYAQQLIDTGSVTQSQVDDIMQSYNALLSEEYIKSEKYEASDQHFGGFWKNMKQARQDSVSDWKTGCDIDNLRFVGSKSVQLPEDFTAHPSIIQNHCQGRLHDLFNGEKINWATAESLAFGTLLLQGYNIRLCGQDVGRGTFSHRHVMIVDQKTEEPHFPLNHLDPNQKGHLEVVNSLLSEEAVLAYEYGFSIGNPNNLVIWEAQFGDFFNTAQVIVDNFIAGGEAKWLLQSGLVLLLPHGFDGAGPEHSSCKIERFLQMTDSSEIKVDSDEVNMEVVYPTMPSQYFHLLRRQVIRDYRKPLIIAAPKVTLRLKAATSSLTDMVDGSIYHSVIDDKLVNPSNVSRIIFCSGKHYFALAEHRHRHNITDTAIVRLETLCPFPAENLKLVLRNYSNAKEYIWSQEEPRNAGSWSFVSPRFENLINVKLHYVGRQELATVATGVVSRHQIEAQEVISKPFVNLE